MIVGFIELFGISLIIPFIAYAGKLNTFGFSNTVMETVVGVLLKVGIPKSSVTLALGLIFWGAISFANFTVCFYQYVAFRVIYTHKAYLTRRLVETMAQKNIGWYDSQNSSELSKSIMSDVHACTEFINAATQVSGVAMRALLLFSFFLYAQPRLAIAVAVSLGILAWLSFLLVHRPLLKAGLNAFGIERTMYRLSSELVGGVCEIKVANKSDYFVSRISNEASRAISPQIFRFMPGFATRAVMETLAVGAVIVILLYFSYIDGNIDNGIPMLSAYALGGIRLLPNIQQAIYFLTQMRFHYPAIGRIAAIFDHDGDEVASATLSNPLTFERTLELKSINFEYQPDKPTLHDVSLTISRRQRVAFVGQTGAGKSTLLDIILGLRQPKSGNLYVDDLEIFPDKCSAWRRFIGYVAQSTYLCDASLAENIAFGCEPSQINLSRVQECCQIAQLHEFVLTLPEKYETVVGDRGVRLSGGQRQRIAIARALYLDPEIIVFDEATSALDSQTESSLLEALDALKGVKTLIVIAHRLQTVWDFDNVFVVDQGKVVAQGTCPELLEGCEAFQLLANTYRQDQPQEDKL